MSSAQYHMYSRALSAGFTQTHWTCCSAVFPKYREIVHKSQVGFKELLMDNWLELGYSAHNLPRYLLRPAWGLLWQSGWTTKQLAKPSYNCHGSMGVMAGGCYDSRFCPSALGHGRAVIRSLCPWSFELDHRASGFAISRNSQLP